MSDTLTKALKLAGSLHGRSKQVQIGASEVGGCRARVWHRLNGTPIQNPDTLMLASFMGTAIHTAIEDAMKALDPFGEDILTEIEVEHSGLKGHVDCFVKSTGEVLDWKTTTKKNLSQFPKLQQRWQVHLYGYLLTHDKGFDVKTVTLVAIPRDGNETHIVTHTEPYDEAVALEALEWLQQQREASEPIPDMNPDYFCKFYCQFYNPDGDVGCAGRPKADSGLLDDESAQMALAYLDLMDEAKQLTDQADALKAALTGVSGEAAGVKVSTTVVAGSRSVDADAVKLLLGDNTPYKQGKESTRCSIKRT